jgi:hypothetical protein
MTHLAICMVLEVASPEISLFRARAVPSLDRQTHPLRVSEPTVTDSGMTRSVSTSPARFDRSAKGLGCRLAAAVGSAVPPVFRLPRVGRMPAMP